MTEIPVQQRDTEICHWCTKEMPRAAKNCPHCGKLRKDIYEEKVLAYSFMVGMFLPTVIFYILNKLDILDGHRRLEGRGLMILICLSAVFVVCVIGTLYHSVRVSRKLGTWVWF